MTTEAYTIWREQLTVIQNEIDDCEDDYYGWLDIYHSQGAIDQRTVEYKIARQILVDKLEAHFKAEPNHY